MEARTLPAEKPFHASLEKFIGMTRNLESATTRKMPLSGLESIIEIEGRELLRTMLQEHLHLRGPGDVGPSVEGTDGVIRTHTRQGSIAVKTIFGEVQVERILYGMRGQESLAPKDAMLNLPENIYSHGLERRLAGEVAKGSFDAATEAVQMQTGVTIPKRQAEEIACNAAQDFDAFYAERSTEAIRRAAADNEFLVLTTDGKGVVMRMADLREATRKKAEQTNPKLKTRLSKGEKKNAKRMAQVASVYSIEPHERTPQDIIDRRKDDAPPPPRPVSKRVWASLATDAKDVVAAMFDEAHLRDPKSRRRMVILVDGQPYQLDLIENVIKSRGLTATIVLDIVHVIEYLWRASRAFHAEGTPEGEAWVSRYLLMVLEGKANQVAAAIRRSATRQGKTAKERDGLDSCADYLHNNAPYMNYAKYLAQGMPIATGVIEGACRHLVKDRMDITGARWSLTGAEAVLRLRSLRASGDLEEYWRYHEAADYQRNHRSRYAHPHRIEGRGLKVVK